MEKIKAYTDLEQSKKLTEFLPIESADMEYMFLKRDGSKVSNMPFVKDDEELEWPNHSTYDFIPCWSLAALLKILPIEAYIKIDNVCCTLDITRNTLDTWFVSYYNRSYGCSLATCTNKELLDACYEMILKLHKLKML